MVDAVDAEAVEDLDAYHKARFHAAREAGLTRLEAARFVWSDTSLKTLRGLRAAGCPADKIARIVRNLP